MNPLISSVFYLERVGFEAKVNFRHNLKNGSNIIGRNDTQGVDIGINSFHCSRKHCLLTVSDDVITVQDLNSSNGTTLNGSKLKGAVEATAKEHDLIGIVGGGNPLSELVGNFGFIVYRLCKYSNNNIQTFEIEDEDPIELSDNEEGDIICLDSEGEAVDVGEENDLDIQLSRNFNLEVKKELIDFEDDWEALTLHVKKESLEFRPSDDVDESLYDMGECSNHVDQSLYETGECSNHVDRSLYETGESSDQIDENFDDFPVANSDSDDDSQCSAETVCFSANDEQNNQSELPKNRANSVSPPLSDQTNLDSRNLKKPQLEQKLQDTVSKIIESAKLKRKQLPEMIYAKPFEKRRKTKKGEGRTERPKPKQETKEQRKERLKATALASPKRAEPNHDKPSTSTHTTPTTPKVKFTPNNRGSFLTDMAQMPVSPKIILKKQKEEKLLEEIRLKAEKQVQKPKPNEVSLETVSTPPELEQKILENMHSGDASQVSEPSPVKEANITKLNGINSLLNELPRIVNVDSKTGDIGSPTNGHEEKMDLEMDLIDDRIGMDIEGNIERNENDDDDDYDEQEAIYQFVMNMPPDTGTITVIETCPKPVNIKSILKLQTDGVTTKKKRRVVFKDFGFQYDPRHKIITDLTAYDCSQFETVDAFFKTACTDVRSFADSYEEYEEYRETLVSLMLVELWKEIELEYVNSKIHNFTPVTINYRDIERRGEGRRMIFQCQANALYKTQTVCNDHLVLATCECNGREIEFIALVTEIGYSKGKTETENLAYFTMETSETVLPKNPAEMLPVENLKIRPITVIQNTLNSLKAIHNLQRSPLLNLVMNPLAKENLTHHAAENFAFKCYDKLDDTQRKILNLIYRRCINLNAPNISLLEGAAGTGKTCMIANLALQLVYGDGLPKPLKILICSKTNGSINDLTRKLIHIRDDTAASTKIQLVRFGMLENMDKAVQRVSVQHLKESGFHSQFNNYDDLVSQKNLLELKMAAINLTENIDHATSLKVLQKQQFKVNALLDRFEGLERKKLRDSTTFMLNSCDIICTTLASIPKLQNYVSNVDVCIIDEATQCNEAMTLLAFQFGNPSMILVGDSQLLPLPAYSPVVKSMNYGNSMFARFQKLLLGKPAAPVYEMNFQYRLQQEILMWPNHQFYKNRLVPHASVIDNRFPIVPYKIISYSLDNRAKETDNIMLVIKVLLGHVDWQTHSLGMICTNFKQNSILKNRLKEHAYIATSTAESYIGEKDVVVIWVSEEHGISSLAHQQVLNAAVTRARKSLIICGANLTSYKNRPVWKSLLENANKRKCLQHFKVLTAPKICSTLSKNVLEGGPKCNICKLS